MTERRDEFLSEEDLDVEDLSITNDLDRGDYSHGVFDRDPAPAE